jgi:hypothetical protein
MLIDYFVPHLLGGYAKWRCNVDFPVHILAMGGGGFSMEADNPLLDDILISLAQKPSPNTPSKNFPATGTFGPFIVTADAIGDYRTFRPTTRVNGEPVQEAGLDQLIFPIPTLIEYCSAFTPLAPGARYCRRNARRPRLQTQPASFLEATQLGRSGDQCRRDAQKRASPMKVRVALDVHRFYKPTCN